MIHISEATLAQLRQYKERQGPDLMVRVGIVSGSMTGPKLGISMDERAENDQVFTFDGLDIIVEKGLLGYCEKITVEYVLTVTGGCAGGEGFRIVAKNPI